MEHHFVRIFLTIALIIITSGCKRPLEQPELVDPIYREHVDAADKIKKAIETEKKSLEDAKLGLKAPGLTLGERRQQMKMIGSLEKKLILMEQDQKFMEVRARTRKAQAREIYPKRFEKGLPWPIPEEIERFETNKRLKHASRNWVDRVPKLNYGKPVATENKAKETAKEGAGEH